MSIDMSKDRVIITDAKNEQHAYEKSKYDEIIVQSDVVSDVFSVDLNKQTQGRIQLYSLGIIKVWISGTTKIMIMCKKMLP